MGRPRKEENIVGHSTKYDYLSENREIVKAETIESMNHALAPSWGKISNNTRQGLVQKSGYCSQDNVKEYEHALVTHSFGKNAPKKKGRGTFFETVEEFDEWAIEFFDLCARLEIVPTISGLCCWLKVNRNQIQVHANNPNSIFYESCKQAIDICHNVLEAGATEMKFSTQAYVFQAKNYYGLKDTQDLNLGVSTGNSIVNNDSLDALQKQRENELKMTSIEPKEAKILEEK